MDVNVDKFDAQLSFLFIFRFYLPFVILLSSWMLFSYKRVDYYLILFY